MRFTKRSAAALTASLSFASAQTFTDCDPLQKTCPKDTGLPASTYTADFADGKGAAASWTTAAYSTINYGSQGAEFSISQPKQAPTIQTDFYIFFGRIDVKMKAAAGTGIVSSIVLESDDLDEIDWEFLGGNTTVVETNFFGKGNTTVYDRAIYYPVSSPQTEFHTYTIDWNAERLMFIIDGTTVRNIPYNDPLALGGKNYPQTPMRLKLGNWCGGCPGEPSGTITWAGGNTTFDDAPYIMYVESVNIQNYNPADSYEYGDMSGSWQSIKIINNGKESSPTGTATGAASVSGDQTSAPTKTHHVDTAKPTGAAVSKTIKGHSYSMNQSSISAENSGHTATATTQVPGSEPTGANGSPASGPAAGSSASAGSPASTNGAVANGVAMSGAFMGLLAGALMV